jgi:hypothetical protein
MEEIFDLTPENFENIIKHTMHEPQPHTDAGKRGEHIVNGITIRQIAECVLRGMLDGGTLYHDQDNAIDTIHLGYHQLIDLIYEVEWIDNFDPVAIQQNVSCHIEKVLRIYPNVPPLTANGVEDGE